VNEDLSSEIADAGLRCFQKERPYPRGERKLPWSCFTVAAIPAIALLCAMTVSCVGAGKEHSSMPVLSEAHFILFVTDQEMSTAFYFEVLGVSPRLNVPGMTQFSLPGGATLGLMPAAGIKRLLGDPLPDPQTAAGIPRSELYLLVDDPARFLRRAIDAGATELSPVQPRGWGDSAGYCLDLDGHVLAFAN
jgi:uncharacterized protein